MFLTEYEGYDLTKYNDFLIECSKKDYSNQKTHRHHILPKFMGGENKGNLIRINQQDHFDAHLILAFCFPIGMHEYHGNIFSASRLQTDIIVPENFQQIFSESQSLIGFGRKHSLASRRKISESKKGFKHTPESIEKMRMSHRGKTHTEEHKEHLRQVLKELYATGKKVPNFGDYNSVGRIEYRERNRKRLKTEQNGKDNPFAKKIEHVESGRIFDCIKDAMNEFGFTNYNILYRRIEKGIFRLLEERPPTHENLKYGKKAKEFLCLETGQVFKSRKDAIEQLPFSSYMFDKLCKEGKFQILEK